MIGGALGTEGLTRLAEPALEQAGREGIEAVEAVVTRSATGLARFAGSQISQHVDTESVDVNVRAVAAEGRVGVVSRTVDDPSEVAAAAAEAAEIARLAPPDPDFPGLAPAAPVQSIPVDEAALAAGPDDRARTVAALLAEVPDDVDASGAYSTGAEELGVFTSEGQSATTLLSHVSLVTVLTGATSSGYAESGGRGLDAVDPVAQARRALAKVEAGKHPVEVGPAAWPVVLEPPAVGALVQFLVWLGFSARAYQEGRTFTVGRLGDEAMDRDITIVDDALSPDTLGFPFDYEGTPKQRVELVREGVLAGLVHDRATAAKAGTESTGHGLLAPNTYGPLAMNALMLPGDGGALEDLVAGCERGLAVTRFHYTNVVQPRETVLTGMTRDGTFLIEDGKLVGAVRNLRFTQSVLEALATVEAVSTETGYGSELFFFGSRCPGLRLPSFRFTSTTTFG